MVRMREIQARRSSSSSLSSLLSIREERPSSVVIGVKKKDSILCSCYYCYYHCYRESSLDLCSFIANLIFRYFELKDDRKSQKKTNSLHQRKGSENSIIRKSVGKTASSTISKNEDNTFSSSSQLPTFDDSFSTTTYPSPHMYEQSVVFEKFRYAKKT